MTKSAVHGHQLSHTLLVESASSSAAVLRAILDSQSIGVTQQMTCHLKPFCLNAYLKEMPPNVGSTADPYQQAKEPCD